jgi:hypothetical protein
MLFRVEHDLATNERIEIAQAAYVNADGDILIIDATEPAPDGYAEYVPEQAE